MTAATLLEIKEGQVTLLIKQLQNKNKHHPFHLGHRVRHKCKGALDHVGMDRGRELHPRNKTVLCFLGRKNVGKQVALGKEPPTPKSVEDVEDQKVIGTSRRN